MPNVFLQTPLCMLRRRPLNRRYIVVEGIYANSGLLAPLDKMVPLKHKCAHRMRLATRAELRDAA